MSIYLVILKMDYLSQLENQSIYIIREAYCQIPQLGMLWSIGKDSTVMLWLVRKAFLGYCPIPLIHIDTSYKIPEMIEYRDKMAKKWDLNLIIGGNKSALEAGMNYKKGRMVCCNALKTEGLQQIIDKHKFQALMLGIRRDEEGSRAKERFFSTRDKDFNWNYKDQPPELWDQFNTSFPKGSHIRVHPILHWREVDIWKYIKREKIPIIDLYFAKNGKRYRSLGCSPCTNQIISEANTLDKIITELESSTDSERSGRAQDKEENYAMQKLRAKGYM